MNENNSNEFVFYLAPDARFFERKKANVVFETLTEVYLSCLKKGDTFYKVEGVEGKLLKLREKIGLSEKQETRRFLHYIANNFNSLNIKDELENFVKYKKLEFTIQQIH